ncbi:MULTISPECIES: IclR family transcriptional regulator C-terminal domain-containing protein [unclassified Bradyrhizobium]|uniref:IclR family transcriptional regulator domain-containing protein n=1 Tax=Bradyrhizobium TaxID=374 RepID=UPI000D65461A|nr:MULTISPECIES: IclR family transcriptional regulator C-terminal domain-containing protein [unclassified Bradyrhizobium]MCA1468376.1 helix-turn-helix domain-containing protein [Bradyrhizobium sp. IC3195]MCA1496730.1 helix-turn-helix domain-containing protein [Bradyrhizobium sp. NBAIM14]MCA1532503.1 helix-turn-helix domain-containing protein [Bradyrhizobium sp. NBAIM03]MCA1548128.1 helix-turn-helix domain-containing protein [Bradyrhizobium sp. BRP19]PWE80098.1 IclR family transcriptional regul
MPRLKRTEEEEKAREGSEFIETLDRGLRVIQSFGIDRRPMTLSDLSKSANLPRATVRRILMTLVKSGFVAGNERLFSLTPRVLLLASAYLASNQISTVMQPLMDEVAGKAREVCSLAVLDGEEVVFIARSSPARVFSTGLDIGYRLPAFCTSVGRVLLGRLANDELTRTVDGMKLAALTQSTLVDKSAVIATIIADRTKGYSLVDQEAEEGFRSISVPIRRYDGAVIAAANIGAHVDRITTGEMIDRFLPLLKEMSLAAQPLLV